MIVDDLRANTHIKTIPGCAEKPSIDWRLYKERRQIECFFNKFKRFRPITLRCRKTISALMSFVHLAYAMIWLRQVQTPLIGSFEARSAILPVHCPPPPLRHTGGETGDGDGALNGRVLAETNDSVIVEKNHHPTNGLVQSPR